MGAGPCPQDRQAEREAQAGVQGAAPTEDWRPCDDAEPAGQQAQEVRQEGRGGPGRPQDPSVQCDDLWVQKDDSQKPKIPETLHTHQPTTKHTNWPTAGPETG